MGSALRCSTDIRMVLAASASAGAAMIVVETYWQLAFEGLFGGATWALGPVNCAGMGAAAAGSAVAMRWGSALSRRVLRGPRAAGPRPVFRQDLPACLMSRSAATVRTAMATMQAM